MQITSTTQWNYSIALYAESKFEITAAVNSFPSLLADRALETQDLVGQILLQRFSLIHCYMQLHSRKYPMVGSSYVQMYPVITSKPVSSTEPLVPQPLQEKLISFSKAKLRDRFPLACNAGVFQKVRERSARHLGYGKQRKLGVCENLFCNRSRAEKITKR